MEKYVRRFKEDNAEDDNFSGQEKIIYNAIFKYLQKKGFFSTGYAKMYTEKIISLLQVEKLYGSVPSILKYLDIVATKMFDRFKPKADNKKEVK